MGEALALERVVGTDGVLGIYLTLAPFGGNLEGVRAASLAYFGKEPAHLTAARGGAARRPAALARTAAARPPSRGGAAGAGHGAAADGGGRRDLGADPCRGRDRKRAGAAAGDAVPRRRIWRARCTGRRWRRWCGRRSNPGCSARSRRCCGASSPRSIPQASDAAIVVDNRERRVIAYVGNADFGSTARHGTIDMAQAVRSPGSALKPFIYAMAFDRLIVHPETLVDDRPRRVRRLCAGRFRRALSRYGQRAGGAAIFAQRAGRRGARPARGAASSSPGSPQPGSACACRQPTEEPGLAVALGGVGTTLTDLATLYAGARRMTARSRRCATRPTRRRGRRRGSSARSPRGTSATSCAARRRRPACCRTRSRASRRLAYKTGTSYGFRDAWAVGLRPRGDDRGLGRDGRTGPRCRGAAGGSRRRRSCSRSPICSAPPAPAPHPGRRPPGALLVGGATCRRGCASRPRPQRARPVGDGRRPEDPLPARRLDRRLAGRRRAARGERRQRRRCAGSSTAARCPPPRCATRCSGSPTGSASPDSPSSTATARAPARPCGWSLEGV